MKRTIAILLIFLLTACTSSRKPEVELTEGNDREVSTGKISVDLIDENGQSLMERVKTPEGFERVQLEEASYGYYLRNLKLKPHGVKVKFFDGREKGRDVHEAVIDMDVGNRDLQQCADAAIRLRAEYLYSKGMYDKIHFNFTNGFKAEYSKWRQGRRITVQGNNANWTSGGSASTDYESFRKYLDMVFSYAGTLSLAKELQRVSIEDMRIGDVFLKGGSPGHCVIIVDMVENKTTGEKLFMVAQSYMPAQDIHLLKNPGSRDLSPWYSINFGERLITPEWEFTRDQLMRFGD